MIIFGFQENDVLHIISNVFFFQRICWTAFWYFRSINSNFSCRKVIRIPGENTLCLHCAKSVQIRSYFWSVFSRIRTEYGEVQSIYRIQSECGELRTTNISVSGHFSSSANMKSAGHGEPFWHTNMLLLAVEFSGSSHQETYGPSV